MNLQREISTYEAKLAGIDVFLLQPVVDCRMELPAKRALVIGELYERKGSRLQNQQQIPSQSLVQAPPARPSAAVPGDGVSDGVRSESPPRVRMSYRSMAVPSSELF